MFAQSFMTGCLKTYLIWLLQPPSLSRLKLGYDTYYRIKNLFNVSVCRPPVFILSRFMLFQGYACRLLMLCEKQLVDASKYGKI